MRSLLLLKGSGICLCVHSVKHNKLRLIQGVWFTIKRAVENAGLSFTLIINQTMKYWPNSGNLGSFTIYILDYLQHRHY